MVDMSLMSIESLLVGQQPRQLSQPAAIKSDTNQVHRAGRVDDARGMLKIGAVLHPSGAEENRHQRVFGADGWPKRQRVLSGWSTVSGIVEGFECV